MAIPGLFLNSCMPVKKGVITKKWYEEEISSMSIVMVGKITTPMYINDDEDFVIKVEGFNKRGKFKEQNYYITKCAYDTLQVGDWFCATEDCYTKDK
jgi:hypothetical protein